MKPWVEDFVAPVLIVICVVAAIFVTGLILKVHAEEGFPVYHSYVYRIYTENVKYPEVMELVEKYFHSATVYRPEGIYKDVHEHALVIEVIEHSTSFITTVNDFAWDLKKLTNQNTVLVTRQEIEVKEMS